MTLYDILRTNDFDQVHIKQWDQSQQFYGKIKSLELNEESREIYATFQETYLADVSPHRAPEVSEWKPTNLKEWAHFPISASQKFEERNGTLEFSYEDFPTGDVTLIYHKKENPYLSEDALKTIRDLNI